MKVLIVLAHPEPKSLTTALFNVTVDELEKLGHEVKTTDLYALNWKSAIDGADFPEFHQDKERLVITNESGKAYHEHKLTKDVLEEQAKLEWADMLILQFPLWWFTMPAILKGWVDRVFSFGLGYGVGYSAEKPHGTRYGEGSFKGKRAMLSVTIGGPASNYKEMGVNGDIFHILWPINHGVLFYPGFDVLEPFTVYRTNKFTEEDFEKASKELRERLKHLETEKPIPFRSQNGGDYDLHSLELKPDVISPEEKGLGLRIHLKEQSN
ncbi:unnamed protein product [Ambrosiozyma monospora]|uniref:Unnamed protein product n=1 Tax=Ambrosiozyma monospora TaxID=43982 RepID=A0ACB5SX52_AMBMO|nr:unnamed protein product [Ambrosiozyma monospora]